MKTKRLLTMLLATAALVFAVSRAEAACTITTTAVSFGSYNVFAGSADDGTGQITYRCTGPPTPRHHPARQGRLAELQPAPDAAGQRDAQLQPVPGLHPEHDLGDGTGGTQTYSRANPPNGQNINLSVFGRIPAGQDVSAGTYSATVTATIFF